MLEQKSPLQKKEVPFPNGPGFSHEGGAGGHKNKNFSFPPGKKEGGKSSKQREKEAPLSEKKKKKGPGVAVKKKGARRSTAA